MLIKIKTKPLQSDSISYIMIIKVSENGPCLCKTATMWDNISMISNVTMIYWSFGGRMSIRGVQSLNIQSFFPDTFHHPLDKISNSNSIPLHTKTLYDLFMLKFRLGVCSNLAITTKCSNDLCNIQIKLITCKSNATWYQFQNISYFL